MTTAQAIAQRIEALPEEARVTVLDFVRHLEARTQRTPARGETDAWRVLSLASAMRGMEDEPSLYTTADLQESFR